MWRQSPGPHSPTTMALECTLSYSAYNRHTEHFGSIDHQELWSKVYKKRKQIFVIYVYLGQVQFSSYEIEKGNLMFSSKNWNFFHFNFLHQGLCQSIICHRFSILGSLMLEESSATLHRWKSELSSAIENIKFPPSAINIATVSSSVY